MAASRHYIRDIWRKSMTFNPLKWLFSLYMRYKNQRRYRKRLEELKKRDPFIYR